MTKYVDHLFESVVTKLDEDGKLKAWTRAALLGAALAGGIAAANTGKGDKTGDGLMRDEPVAEPIDDNGKPVQESRRARRKR